MKSDTRQIRSRIAIWLGLAALCGTPACGSSDGESSQTNENQGGMGGNLSAEASGGSSNPSLGGATSEPIPDLVVGPQGRPFEPPGLVLNYTGTDDGGLKIVAYTLHQSYGYQDEPMFHVAVRNEGLQTICTVRLSPSFKNSSGIVVGNADDFETLASPIYMVDGAPTQCLGVGDVGMGALDFRGQVVDLSDVAQIDYGVSGRIEPNAQLTEEVRIVELSKEVAFGTSQRFVGSLVNHSNRLIESPTVYVFGVDDKGRPIADVFGIDLISVGAGRTWEFSTTSFDEGFSNFVVYARYRHPFNL